MPVIAIMVMIFIFSSQPATESSGISLKVAKAVARMIYPSYEELSEAGREALLEPVHYFVRKAAHFTEFALLGFFLALHIKTVLDYRAVFRRLYCFSLAFISGALYAISDEFHQLFVSARSANITDIWIDSAGVAIGATILLILFYYYKGAKKLKPRDCSPE